MSRPEEQPPKVEGSRSLRVQEKLHRAKETLEAGGLDIPGVGGVLFFWRKLGVKGTILIILLCGFPLGQYSVLRSAVHYAIPRMIGGFGLDFDAEEWSLAPLSLKATARNVRLREHTDEKAFLTASEIEFKGSLWTVMRSFPDMVTFHVFGGRQPFNEIIVRRGELHVERSLSGQMNWEDFVAAVPQERIAEALNGVYPVQLLRFEDFRISYLENLPGGSGDGLIRSAQAQIKMDEITATFTNLMQPEKAGDRPTTFRVRGRSADGVFEVAGNGGLFPSRDYKDTLPLDGLPKTQAVAFKQSGSTRVEYPFEMSIYLDNIAAAAIGRMIPNATLVPTNGSIGGTVKVVRTAEGPKCDSPFQLKDVRLAPNPKVLPDPEEFSAVQKGLLVAYTGPFDLCEKPDPPLTLVSNVKPEPPVAMALARLTQQATAGASPGIQALVARDRQSLRGEHPQTTVADLTNVVANEVGQKLTRAVGAKLGINLQPSGANAFTNSTSSNTAPATNNDSGNALTKGVKGVGSGIKKLFGGGKDKSK